MQPYLKQYINEVLAEQYQLAAMQAEQDAREAARQDRELAVFRETSTPLLDRLKRLIATIPPEERQTPRPLEWFRTRLRGREGRGAHAAELGDALRQLGYTRQRAWSDHENGFRSLWHPPKNLTKE